MNSFRIRCLIASTNAIGCCAALLALWTNQSLTRIAIAYSLGASIPLSIAVIAEAQMGEDDEPPQSPKR
jgi:hypothetical protein